MKYLIFTFLFLFSQPNWFKYKSETPDFSIQFPKEPVEKEKYIKTDIGETFIRTVFLQSSVDSTDNYLYLVNYYEFDQNIFEGDSAINKVEYLDLALAGIAENLDAEILYSNTEHFRNCPTVIYRLNMNQNENVMKGKLVLSEKYFYSLQIFTQKQFSLNKNIDKFINSFVYTGCD